MTIFAGGEDLERLDNWTVAEHVSSMTVLDFKDHLNTVISRVNQDPELLAYVHNHIKSLEGKRNPKRDLQAIADDITKVLDSNGYITWKQAKDSYDLDNAKQFERVMNRVPESTRCKKLHRDGGRNWYYHRDIDPSKWIASHDEGPIDVEQDPKEAASALLQIVLTRYADEPRVNVHKILIQQKSMFRLPDKFRMKSWAEAHFTPLMYENGYVPTPTRKVYHKQ
tara:strand:+ start:1054 stop:1725 length:672 start_codon:yes stop_codon:yes gene_type:complete